MLCPVEESGMVTRETRTAELGAGWTGAACPKRHRRILCHGQLSPCQRKPREAPPVRGRRPRARSEPAAPLWTRQQRRFHQPWIRKTAAPKRPVKSTLCVSGKDTSGCRAGPSSSSGGVASSSPCLALHSPRERWEARRPKHRRHARCKQRSATARCPHHSSRSSSCDAPGGALHECRAWLDLLITRRSLA